MKKYIYIMCLFALSFSMRAQDKTLELSLDEAIDYALLNSYKTKASKNDINSAKKRVWETTTIGLPQIEGKVDYINNLKAQFPGIDFNQDGIIDFNAKHSMTAGLTLKQLIFDGSYLVGLQASRTYLKISEQANEKTELLTRESVINAYGNILVAQKSIEILKRNKKVNDRILKGAKVGYENGLAEEEDVEQFEIIKGNIENNIKSSERLRDIAFKMLNISLGIDINSKVVLKDDLESLVLAHTNLNLISHQFDIDKHIDFRIAKNDRESKRLLMRLEQSKALPSLSAFVNYNYIANANSFDFFKSQQKWINTSVLGVSLKVPVFSSLGRNSKTAQAKIALDNADLMLKETKEKLNLVAQNAKSDYQLSIDNYQTAKKNLNLAERIEQKHQIKFKEGLSTSFDLLQAQNQLYSQQTAYVQAMLNIIAKKASLENALNIPIK